MKKNEKFLNKIPLLDKEKILVAMNSILADNLLFLNVKKLSGIENTYRVRIGKFRIKFIKHATHNEIIEITRRSDNTY